jgi:hypothetical protein
MVNCAEFQGKLRASIKWLIARIFERNIPDKLQNAFFVDEQVSKM